MAKYISKMVDWLFIGFKYFTVMGIGAFIVGFIEYGFMWECVFGLVIAMVDFIGLSYIVRKRVVREEDK